MNIFNIISKNEKINIDIIYAHMTKNYIKKITYFKSISITILIRLFF